MKKKIIISGAVLALTLLGYVGYFGFSKTKKISIKSPVEMEEKNNQTNVEGENEKEISFIESNQETTKKNLSDAKNDSEIGTDINSSSKTSVSRINIINKLVGWGYSIGNNRKIEAIIIHSSYDAEGNNPYNVTGLIQEYKSYGVAPHYLIDRQGQIYLLVSEKNVAYHAGVAKLPDGTTTVNEVSLGIEIMTTKTDSPTEAQYASLKLLISDIKSRYNIKYVLGHSDIAKGRKDDPWNFNWDKLK